MTAVDIFKASRMQQIEDTTVVSGLVDPNGHLLLKTRVDEIIDAGSVIGPMGPGFTNRGAWAPTTVYAKNDIVTASGSTFVVNVAHTSATTAPTVTTPGPNVSLWAQKGVDGTIGKDGSEAIPAGTISLWGSDTAPSNWLICNGQAVSRSLYPSLFEAIGVKYGAGDGVNTFNLPSLHGRVPVGLDGSVTEFNTLGKTGGERTHLLTAAESGLPAHNHTQNAHQHIQGDAGVNSAGGYLSAPSAPSGNVNSQSGQSTTNHFYTSSETPTNNPNAAANAAQAHNVLQPYSVVNFIIKATAGETPGDSELTTRLSTLEANYSATPAGTITGWGGATAPTNWLICDGSAVSRTTYASLFSAIGTTYGLGNGSTTFNLPNLKGRVPVGRDSTQTEFDVLGEIGGEKAHTLTMGELPVHTPRVFRNGSQLILVGSGAADAAVSVNRFHLAVGATATDIYTPQTEQIGLGQAHNVLQPYQVVNYIIKITNGDTKADSQLTQRVSSLEARTQLTTRVQDRTNLLQRLITGGGLRKCDSNASISWSAVFRTMGAGRDELVPSGWFDIAMPPNGTVIPVIGHPTVTSVTVAAGKINFTTLSGYGALYYDLPYGSLSTTQPSRFKLVDYSSGPIVIPPTWLLIVQHNIDAGSPDYRWGDGRMQDRWRNVGLVNGWINYSGNAGPQTEYAPAAWRYESDGKINLRGLIANGTASTIFQVGGDGYGPDYRSIFVAHCNLGTARIDVSYLGEVMMSGYMNGGTNAFVSLEGIGWYPRGNL